MKTSPLRLSILLLLLLFSYSSFAKTPSKKNAQDSLFSFSGEYSSILDNTEYFNTYTLGETVFSTLLKSRLVVHPDKEFSFSAGLLVRKEAGDNDFLTDIRPLFRAQFSRGGVTLLLGELYGTAKNHGLPSPLLIEQYRYRPGAEEGFQVILKKERLAQDFFIDYPLNDTKHHQEQIRIGDVLHWAGIYGGIQGYLYASHLGGQLNPHPEPVRWNTTAAIGGTLKYPVKKAVEEFGITELIVGSKTDHDTAILDRHTGYGSCTETWVDLFGCRIAARAWFGDGYKTWYGDPFYTADTYYHFEVTRRTEFAHHLSIDMGIRLCWVDIPLNEFIENNDNQLWFELRWEPGK
jgi:hypothetical protein